ncbi:MAG TPA: carboxypeptidase-like regulatory domain-containing protein, partial [Gemmatimonadaceae bacterium]
MRTGFVAAFSSAVLVGTGIAGAQTVRGVVMDGAQHPVTGVVVLMLDSASNVVARGLSGEQGDFHVAAARSGAYRLRTMRIGYRSTISQPIALLAGGEVNQRLVLSGVSVSLDTVRIVDRGSCRISSDLASATFEAWEQARTALIAAQLTAGGRAITATTVTYDRALEPDGRRVTQQASRIHTDYVTHPWRAPAADSLHRAGYVVTERDNTTTYRAPGIDVLLSAVFVEDHCFHLIADAARPGTVGIAFEPSPERKRVPEIRGTLWVDRRTAELRRLDYRYVNVSSEQESAGAGGEMSFARFANGGWAIASWSIRMPVLEQSMRTQQFGGTQTHVAEIKVSGGELALATIQSARGRDTLWSRPPLVLAGTVVDSASGAAVAGAH